jgi:hypothetical protein
MAKKLTHKISVKGLKKKIASKPKYDKSVVCFRLPNPVVKEFKAKAKSNGVSATDIIVELMKRYSKSGS